MDNKLIYVDSNDGKQNYPFYRLTQRVKWCNYETLGTSVILIQIY